VKYVRSIGAMLLAASTSAPANPWDETPRTAPYKNLADAVKATTQPGQPSTLNPSCEGMSGDACVRSAESSDKSRSKPLEETSKTPDKPRE